MTKQSGGNFKGRRHQRGKKKQMGGFLGGLLGGGGGKGGGTTSNTGSNVTITNDQGRRNYYHKRQSKNYYGDYYGDYDGYKYTTQPKRKKNPSQQGGFLGSLLGLGGRKGGGGSNTRNSGSNVYITNDRGRRNYYDDYDDDYDYRPRKRRRRRKQKGKLIINKLLIFNHQYNANNYIL